MLPDYSVVSVSAVGKWMCSRINLYMGNYFSTLSQDYLDVEVGRAYSYPDDFKSKTMLFYFLVVCRDKTH